MATLESEYITRGKGKYQVVPSSDHRDEITFDHGDEFSSVLNLDFLT